MEQGDSRIENEESPLIGKAPKPTTEQQPKLLLVYGYFLFVCLGIAPQLLQNATYAENPVFVRLTVEQKAIQSHVVASFMLANAFAFIYLVVTSIKQIPDQISIVCVFAVSIVCSILVAFLWDHTVVVFGHEMSLPLLLLAFLAGAVGNTSVLIFFGFVSEYKELFTSALSAGFGLSGLVPSIMTILQNTGATPVRPLPVTSAVEAFLPYSQPDVVRFDTRIWFFVTAVLIVIFSLSYCLVLPMNSLKDPAHDRTRHEEQHSIFGISDKSINSGDDERLERTKRIKTIVEYLTMMIICSSFTFWVSGVFPYLGETSQQLVWFNNIFLVVPTVGAALAGVVKVYNGHKIIPWMLISAQVILFAYILLVALQKTHSYVLSDAWFVFGVTILFNLLSGYNSTMVYLLLRTHMEARFIQRTQRWAGFAYQVGGTIGIFSNIGLLHANLYVQSEVPL